LRTKSVQPHRFRQQALPRPAGDGTPLALHLIARRMLRGRRSRMSRELLEDSGPSQPIHGSRLVPMVASGRILVPVDFSTCSLAALEHALAMAARFGSSVDVLHVRSMPVGHRTEAAFADSEATQLLDRMMDDLAGGDTVEVRSRVQCGDAAAEIVRIAQEDGYDLIVMGTHGRSGSSQILRGDVAEQVIKRAPCPVLTIRVVGQQASETTDTIEFADTEVP
jgi:nucleotide-binding universal stress UspA family protein